MPRTPDPRDVDQLLEAALREHRPAGVAPDPSSCIDPEVLAAWADGALRTTEARRVESHLASCARCQTMAAAFARSAPPIEATPSWWTRWQVRWLVPALATAGIALATWTIVPDRNRAAIQAPAAPERQEAARSTAIAPPTTPAPGETKPTTLPDVRTQSSSAQLQRDAVARADEAAKRREPPSDKELRSRVSDAIPPAGAVGGVATLPPPPAPPPVPTAPPPPPPAAARPTAQEAFAAKALDMVEVGTVVAEFGGPVGVTAASPTVGGAAAGGRGGGGAGRGGASRMAQAQSPAAPAVRWRIFSSGTVARSLDGKSWSAAAVSASLGIKAGAAPGPQVCWLVGSAGVVLLSTDGQSFMPRPFPERVDLTAVTAVSDRQATVITRDGRRFTTTDGGQSWK